MKVIELLNKIANGEEVPKKLMYDNEEFVYDNYCRDYLGNSSKNWLFDDYSISMIINDEVEVIEEEPRDIEVCGTLFTKSEYNKLFKEDKKIRKITIRASIVGSVENKIENLDINQMAIEDKINEIIDKINEGE